MTRDMWITIGVSAGTSMLFTTVRMWWYGHQARAIFRRAARVSEDVTRLAPQLIKAATENKPPF